MTIKTLYLAIRKRVLIRFAGRFQIRRVAGAFLLLDLVNYIDRQVEAYGAYELEQQKAFFDLIFTANANYFFDVGANWGYYTILAGTRYAQTGLKIYAFEPDATNRHQMSANIFMNGLSDKIEVYDYALSDRRTNLAFQRHPEENRGRSRVADYGQHQVAARVFDEEFDLQAQSIAFKIDVEGHEISVLNGMLRSLKANSCVLQIEAFSDNITKLCSIMEECGYRKLGSIRDDHYFTNIDRIPKFNA